MVKVQEFKAREPWPVIREPDPDRPGGFLFRVHVREDPPSSLGLIFGDFVHNLRASLDNLIYELAPSNARRSRKLSFPICSSETTFKREALPMLRGLPEDIREVIERFQPYPGRDARLSQLRVLNAFWNQDKHRSTIPTALRSDVMTIAAYGDVNQIPQVEAFFGPIHDGKLVGRMAPNQPNMDREPDFPIFIAFREKNPMVLVESLNSMYRFVVYEIFPEFERFQ
jgi:hypothetical protein